MAPAAFFGPSPERYGGTAVSDNYSLIMAVYPAAEGAAETDFDALVRLVADKTVRSEGVILVAHAADGKVTEVISAIFI